MEGKREETLLRPRTLDESADVEERLPAKAAIMSTRTCPPFCATYSLFGSLRGAPIHHAPFSPEAKGRNRSSVRSAFAAASGTVTAQAASSAAASLTPHRVALPI
jgi:hypothetical protein